MRHSRNPWTVAASLVGWAAMTMPATAQHESHGVHPPMPDQSLYFHYSIETAGATVAEEVSVRVPSPSMPAQLDQIVALPAPFDPIRLRAYLPRAVLDQRVEPGTSAEAAPAIELSIDGPAQSYQRWLIAGDMERNRLLSFIGTWRYMAVQNGDERDELFRQFKTELTRDPMVIVSRDDGRQRHEMTAKAGAREKYDDLGCTVEVRRFLPHFGIDEKTGEPANQSEQRMNPAALVSIAWDGGQDEQWVFAKFPEFKKDKSESMPYRILLDSPVGETSQRSPDFVIVTIDRERHEIWTRAGGVCKSDRVKVGDRVAVPDTQYTFHIAEFVPRGRLAESYVSSTKSGSVAALQIELAGAGGSNGSTWLELGKEKLLKTPQGTVLVHFATASAAHRETHP